MSGVIHIFLTCIMNNRLFITVVSLLFCLSLAAQGGRWTEERAWAWYRQLPWLCGVNYIPANAVNYTAMWDKTSFSPKVIDKELQLMEDMGMNCVRVVLQHAVYADDAKYFLRTFDKFLDICSRHGIRVMPIFFDDCMFGVNTDPVIGHQGEPVVGWYAWAWSPSPGYTILADERQHVKLEKYVTDVMRRYANDKRILAWDLYNEPTNSRLKNYSWVLLRKVFRWARSVNPSQPITSGLWNGNKELDDFLSDNSDFITFHCYSNKERTQQEMLRMTEKGRPVVCTEWMNRPMGSTFADILPMFCQSNIGCMAWGLVNGKTQTHLPWGHRPENGEYKGKWQHDIFKGDFTPYDAVEVELIKTTIANRKVADSRMMYGDTTRLGRPYSKDPHVIHFGGRYLMYYSVPPHNWNKNEGWNIGIAESHDLVRWNKVGEITPAADYEQRGLCAPCALVRDGEIHLFYQTYGNRRHDAICHAVSRDGINFVRDATNPIFRPNESEWSCGRAIDAEVVEFRGKYFLYFATRDPEFKIQKLGVAVTDKHSDFSRSSWKMAADESILFPVYQWEGECIEGPSVCVKGNTMYMFYAGAYNNAPQQIGVAKSKDGIHFERMSAEPFKPNGNPGEWNSSESGHPHLFSDSDGKTYLFYQGNNDNGNTWLLTNEEVVWKKGKPELVASAAK